MTSHDWLIVGKLALTFGVLLAIPVWELIQLRRTRPPEPADEAGKRERERADEMTEDDTTGRR